jgi:hypothetical protein
MKLNNLRQLVKEELNSALNKDKIPTEPGDYKIKYTTERGEGFDSDVITITRNDIDDAINSNTNSLYFWKNFINNRLFERGDKVISVTRA